MCKSRFIDENDSALIPVYRTIKRFKCVLKYLKGADMPGIIKESDTEKGVECYVDTDFAGGWNQEEGKDTYLFLFRTGYVITYATCPIIW